jgi:AcrR family transcriptional regulator
MGYVAQVTSGDARQKNILEAAAELFYAHSFAAVGMDAIGERAGITGPAVYRHFASKSEILVTLFDEAIDGLIVATGRRFDDPWEELAYLVRGHTAFVIDQRKLAGVKIREERSLNGPSRRRLRDRERRYMDRWLVCLSRCAPALPPDEQTTVVLATVGMLNSTALWPPTALRAGDIPDQMVDLALGGLRARLDGCTAAGVNATSA